MATETSGNRRRIQKLLKSILNWFFLVTLCCRSFRVMSLICNWHDFCHFKRKHRHPVYVKLGQTKKAPLQIPIFRIQSYREKIAISHSEKPTHAIMSPVEYSIQYLASGQGFIFVYYGKVSEKFLGWTKAKFNSVFRLRKLSESVSFSLTQVKGAVRCFFFQKKIYLINTVFVAVSFIINIIALRLGRVWDLRSAERKKTWYFRTK